MMTNESENVALPLEEKLKLLIQDNKRLYRKVARFAEKEINNEHLARKLKTFENENRRLQEIIDNQRIIIQNQRQSVQEKINTESTRLVESFVHTTKLTSEERLHIRTNQVVMDLKKGIAAKTQEILTLRKSNSELMSKYIALLNKL